MRIKEDTIRYYLQAYKVFLSFKCQDPSHPGQKGPKCPQNCFFKLPIMNFRLDAPNLPQCTGLAWGELQSCNCKLWGGEGREGQPESRHHCVSWSRHTQTGLSLVSCRQHWPLIGWPGVHQTWVNDTRAEMGLVTSKDTKFLIPENYGMIQATQVIYTFRK